MQLREHALGLAKGVAEQHRWLLRLGLPPAQDLAGDRRSGFPAVDREAEGGFADEDVRLDGLERCATGVVAALVIATHQPALPSGFQTDLGRSEDMAGGMKGDPRLANAVEVAVAHRQQVDLCPQPLPQDSFAGGHRPVLAAARPGMVRVGVGDQGPGDRPPGIDPGASRRAVETLRGELQQAAWGEGHGRWAA